MSAHDYPREHIERLYRSVLYAYELECTAQVKAIRASAAQLQQLWNEIETTALISPSVARAMRKEFTLAVARLNARLDEELEKAFRQIHG